MLKFFLHDFCTDCFIDILNEIERPIDVNELEKT